MRTELRSTSRASACASFVVPKPAEPETLPLDSIAEPESLPLDPAAAAYGALPDPIPEPVSTSCSLGSASSAYDDGDNAPTATAASTATPLDHTSGTLECGGDEKTVKQPSGTAESVHECGEGNASQNQPCDAGSPMLFKLPYVPLLQGAEHILLAPFTYRV